MLPPASNPRAFPALKIGAAFVAVTAIFSLSGCGTLRGVGQIGPDLKPTLGASVSVPLGK